MKKNYGLTLLVLGTLLMLSFSAGVQAQTVGPIMWADYFSDAATDSVLLQNPGWFYYGESDGLVGQVTKETADSMAYIQAGSFGGLVGTGLIQTNGVPFINPDDTTSATHDSLVANHWSDPNQEITFRVNLFNMQEGATFICATRMPQGNPDESFPDSDPTGEPAYFMLIDPGNEAVMVGRYPESTGNIPILDPTTWTVLGQAAFTAEVDIWYWVKFYLYEGDLKVKIWEGAPDDEEDAWLIEATDPEPRVTGKYTTLAVFNPVNVAGGDIFKLDQIEVRKVEGATALDQVGQTVPQEFALSNNYPNPFNPETAIEFSVEKTSDVSLKVYSVTGEVVRTLTSGETAPGTYKVVFDGKNDRGVDLPSGLYFYQLTNNSQSITKKMIFMK